MPRAGEDLEIYVRKYLSKFFSKRSRETANSGAALGDNDITLHDVAKTNWQIECKQRSKKNITIQQKDWDHLKEQANARLREPIMVHENERGDVIASLDFRLLVELMEMADLYEIEMKIEKDRLEGEGTYL